jgi:hypothetical protein
MAKTRQARSLARTFPCQTTAHLCILLVTLCLAKIDFYISLAPPRPLSFKLPLFCTTSWLRLLCHLPLGHQFIYFRMPVIFETPGATRPDYTILYVCVGACVLVLFRVYNYFKHRRSEISHLSIMDPSSEKKYLVDEESTNFNEKKDGVAQASQSSESAKPERPRIERPPFPPPFTPPMLSSSPTEMTFSSFEAAMEMVPRRRSYTKTLPDGTEVTGEVIVAEGWRRHTKVFGGGVCKACEESERRMTA